MTNKKQAKQAKKKKQRQDKIKKEALARKTAPVKSVREKVDEILARMDQGDTKEGPRLLERLKQKHGFHPDVLFGLGVVAMKKESYEQARDYFEKAVKASPDFMEAHFNLGAACQNLMDIPNMILAYQHVLNHGTPGHVLVKRTTEILTNLELHFREKKGIGLAKYLEGHHCFQEGLAHMTAKAWDQAAMSFLEAIDINPKSIQSHGNLGICYAVLGKKQMALDAFDKALELDPDYEPAKIHRESVEALSENDMTGEAVLKRTPQSE